MHWKRPWCWKRLNTGREGEDRGWDSWMASPTQWTWVWASSRGWWRTVKPGILQSMGSMDPSDWRAKAVYDPGQVTSPTWQFPHTKNGKEEIDANQKSYSGEMSLKQSTTPAGWVGAQYIPLPSHSTCSSRVRSKLSHLNALWLRESNLGRKQSEICQSVLSKPENRAWSFCCPHQGYR